MFHPLRRRPRDKEKDREDKRRKRRKRKRAADLDADADADAEDDDDEEEEDDGGRGLTGLHTPPSWQVSCGTYPFFVLFGMVLFYFVIKIVLLVDEVQRELPRSRAGLE